jgi:hypothetical protein
MFRKHQFNFIHQMKVIYRFAYWKYYESQHTPRAIAALMRTYAEEQAEIEERKKASKQMRTQGWHPKKPRQPFIKKTLTVMYGDQEYRVQWYANFKTRYLLIFVPSIQPQAILEVISRLSVEDARFRDHEIITSLIIDAYFKIRVCWETQEPKKWYLVRLIEHSDKLEITGDRLPIAELVYRI